MPPTLKKLEGHIAFGLSVSVCVCVCVCVCACGWVGGCVGEWVGVCVRLLLLNGAC